MGIETGNKIKVEYTGTLDDGTVFDSSEAHGAPLELVFGTDRLIKGFEDALVGMEIDEEKDVHIDIEDAYGQVNPDMVQKFPKTELPEGNVEVGMILGMQLPDGREIPATVTEVGETEITIDLNHPLAGQALNFHLKVVGIEEVPAQND